MTKLLLNLAARSARWLPQPIKQLFYKLGPFTHLLRRALNRAAPTGVQPVEVAGGALAGFTVALDLQVEKDHWLGTYEPGLQAAIAHFATPGMVLYDCGANVGYISLVLGRVAGAEGQVFCFEPLPNNQPRIQTNLDLNKTLTQFTLVAKAVTNRAGEAQFFEHASGAMGKASGSAGRQTEYENTITVPTISLDDFIFSEGHPAPQLIKLDIEGGEVLALQGMQRTLKVARPIILLELHGPESAQAAWKTLTEANYTIHQMQSEYPAVNSIDDLDWKAYLVALPA